MAVTIKDVADRAGVSTATVSYVLNGRETSIKITEVTKQRILSASRELDYRPNAMARALSKKRTDTISLVLQYPNIFSGWSGFTNEMMRGATDTAIQLGYDLMLHTKGQQGISQEVAVLTDGRADGALLLRDRDDPLVEQLVQRGFPCLLIFTQSAHPKVWFVDCDNLLGGRLAAEHLLGLGHRRMLHLAGTRRSNDANNRRIGFEQALAEQGVPLLPHHVVEITYAGADYSGVKEALLAPDRPTAVFAWSDDVAIGLLTLAREIGLRVPEDLSVIGFDSTEICNHTSPPLTSIRQPVYEMVSSAFSLLTEQIKGKNVGERQRLFSPVLVERGSCAKCA